MPEQTIGVPLATFSERLGKVAPEHDSHPIRSFDVHERIGPHARRYIHGRFGPCKDLEPIYGKLPRRAYSRLTFEEISMIRRSSMLRMSSSMEEFFESDPRHVLVDRIRTSMWHWGAHRALWNETVDAYNGIAAFSLGLADFEVTLDHFNGYRCDGPGDHSGIWLDGSMAFLVHYRGRPVMTIGFTLMGDRRLLIQQVQTRSVKGNRWLFRFPRNRMEHVIACFSAAFPDHDLFIVDGADVARKNVKGYRRHVRNLESTIDRIQAGSADTERSLERLARYRSEIETTEAGITHLEGDMERLSGFYRDCGQYALGSSLRVNELTHYALAA